MSHPPRLRRPPRHPYGVELPCAGFATLAERRRAGDELDTRRSADCLICVCQRSGRRFAHPVPVPTKTPTAAVPLVWCMACCLEHRLIVPPALANVKPHHPRAARDKS